MPSDATEESTLRPGSYILISTSSPQNTSGDIPQSSAYARRRRPRCSILLPLLALIDGVVTLLLGTFVYRQEVHNHASGSQIPTTSAPRHAASRERQKIILIVIAFSIARACAYAIVGFSKKIHQQGVTIAAISILSTLFYVSIANMLFQARSKHTAHSPVDDLSKWHWVDSFRHVHPTMSILLGIELVFTLLEWVVYIAVVGVKIPPGSNPVRAKRWARSLAKNPGYQRGAESQSLHASDPEDVEQTDDSHGDDTDDEPPASPSRHRSPSHSNRSASSPAAADTLRPQGYGSMLDGPKTPPTNRISRADINQGSVRSNRSIMQAPQIGSRQSELYAPSSGFAELGLNSISVADNDDADDSMNSGQNETDADEDGASDPDDIVDVTPNRKVARQEARMRLAHAALPNRRPSGGTLAALSLFGTGPSQLTPSRSAHDESKNDDSQNVLSNSPSSQGRLTESNSLIPKSTSSGAFSATSIVPSSSSDSVFPSSSGLNTPSSSRSSFKDKKLRLPKWMKPKRKATNQP